MRIVVDADLCEGFGVCRKLRPDRFRLEPDRLPVVITAAEVGPDERDQVAFAVRKCPRAALKLLDE